MKGKPEKITNEERERAFHEMAVFLFELYKKDKQKKLIEQEEAIWQLVFFFYNNIIEFRRKTCQT